MIDQNGSFKIVSNGLGLKFNSVVKDLIAGKKYFFRAYARNKEGVGYGPVLDLKTVRNISPWWIDARSGVATNWWTSSWFGSFYMNEANASWIRHSEMGWVYPMESPKAESGYGKKIWAGSGQMKNFIHFCIRILLRAGFISTEQVRSFIVLPLPG